MECGLSIKAVDKLRLSEGRIFHRDPLILDVVGCLFTLVLGKTELNVS